MGGVGWGRFVAISPLLKNWGSLIEGGVRNKRISNSSLDSGEFTFCSCEDFGCGHVQAKSQKQCSPPKGVRTGKEKRRPLPAVSYLCLPTVPVAQTTRKDVHANSVANVCDR